MYQQIPGSYRPVGSKCCKANLRFPNLKLGEELGETIFYICTNCNKTATMIDLPIPNDAERTGDNGLVTRRSTENDEVKVKVEQMQDAQNLLNMRMNDIKNNLSGSVNISYLHTPSANTDGSVEPQKNTKLVKNANEPIYSCTCGYIDKPNVVHRLDKPCYIFIDKDWPQCNDCFDGDHEKCKTEVCECPCEFKPTLQDDPYLIK